MLLIDVNEAKRQLQNSKIDDPTSGSKGWEIAHNVILDILNNLPTIEALVFPFDVYVINKIQYMTEYKYLATRHFVDRIEIKSLSKLFFVIKLYDGIFLSYEEAEAALAAMKG